MMITIKTAMAEMAKRSMVLSKVDDEYRINYKHGHEGTAYYSSDLNDCVTTGISMDNARNRRTVNLKNEAIEHRSFQS